MKTICSICLDEAGDSLIAFTNCGHVFDKDCATRCLTTSTNCPICRKRIYDRQYHKQQPFYRVYLTTDNDSSSKECKELKEKLEAANNRIKTLAKELDIASNQATVVQRDFQNSIKVSKQHKNKLDSALKELARVKLSQTELISQINETRPTIANLTLVNKKLTKKLSTSEENCNNLRQHVAHQNQILFQQHFRLTNKSNCVDCKKLESLDDNDWHSTPENLEELSQIQMKTRFHDLQEKYDCLVALHREMSMASAGITEETSVKTYIKNLETRLKDSTTREHRLEVRLERSGMQQNLAKELTISKQEKLKLESDLDAIKEAKSLIKAALDTSLETNRRLQRQKESCEKEVSNLQTSLENATKEVQKWIEENRSLQKQLKSSKRQAKKLHSANVKATAEKDRLQDKFGEFSVQYFAFGRSLREFFVSQGSGENLDENWPESLLA